MGNLFSVKDKVVVITGGAGILGSNIAKYLSDEGAKIVILDRDVEKGEKLVAESAKKKEKRFSFRRMFYVKKHCFKTKKKFLTNTKESMFC